MEFLDYYISENAENINPIDFIKKGIIELKISEYREKLFAENPLFAVAIEQDFYNEKANEYWENYYEYLMNIKISNNFIELLKNNELSKTEQKKILKGVSLSPFEKEAMFIKAFNDFNYTYSYYHFDILNIKKRIINYLISSIIVIIS